MKMFSGRFEELLSIATLIEIDCYNFLFHLVGLIEIALRIVESMCHGGFAIAHYCGTNFEEDPEKTPLDLEKISQNYAKVNNKKVKQMARDKGRRRRGGAFRSN